MKIHYLITSLESGGAEAAVPRVVKLLAKAGHEVRITVCEPRDMAAARLLDEAGIGYGLLFDRRRGKAATIFAFLRLVRRSPPDVIWTSLSIAGVVGAIAGAVLGIPVIAWKHSANVRSYIHLTRRLNRLWVADSATVAAFLERGMGIPDDRVMTWPLFDGGKVERYARPWDGAGILHVGSVGRLHPVKNYDLLIEAFARLLAARPDLAGRIDLTIVGDGPERDRLAALVVRHGLGSSVAMPGASDDVPSFLRSWHLYVQPSRYEGMCLAGHEAMAVGLPVIATPVGELRRSVGASGGGVLLDEDVVTSCAAAIGRLVAEPDGLAAMGAAAKAYIAETYSAAAFEEAGLAVVRKVEAIAAGGRSRRRAGRGSGRTAPRRSA